MAELPVVVVDIQRAGPSTGMPTKIEQGDLLLAMHGRNSESPVPVLAPATPGECFGMVLEAFRLAVKYMTPVVLLSDSYLANSSEPWLIPEVDALPKAPVRLRSDGTGFLPYARDPETLARPWAVPGTPGLEHRIGGLGKQEKTGNVSYDPRENQRMNELRAEKVARIAAEVPPVELLGPARGELLVVGWGGTYGAITTAVEAARADGLPVSAVHLRHLNPLPANLGEVLAGFERVLVPELNLGQLTRMLRDRYLAPAQVLAKVEGQPFKVSELRAGIERMLAGEA
jgi:2-oxoglutarate ferredoxin oxidoreductase subunit alpha